MKISAIGVGSLVALVFAIGSDSVLIAQEAEADQVIVPFDIPESYISGLDLSERELDAHPGKDFFQRRVYRGESLSVFVLGGETMVNEQTDFPIDEFIYYLNGHADIEADGRNLTVLGGDYAIAPKGWVGTWTNNGTPRHNLELSVISTQRSNEKSNLRSPFRIDRRALAGITTSELDGGQAIDLVYAGPELIVTIATQDLGTRRIDAKTPEAFYHILSGSVTITPDGSTPTQFFVGDNFVLPNSFAGDWGIEGRNGLRVIKVVAQEGLGEPNLPD